MKEIKFKYNRGKIYKKSFLIWFMLFSQIGTLFYFFDLKTERALIAGIVFNIVISLFSIPGLIIHFNYLSKTIKTTLTLKYDTISLSNISESITLKSSEITQVILHEGPYMTRVPWRNYSWFELIDIHENSIKISCYLLEISDFWQINLCRKISSNNLQIKRSFLPLIK